MIKRALSIVLLSVFSAHALAAPAQGVRVSVDESPFDLNSTHIVTIDARQGQFGTITTSTLRTASRHLEHHSANLVGLIFEVQNRGDFEQWLAKSWLGESDEAYLSARDVRKHRFALGPGLYAVVPYQQGICVAFTINTGRKHRANISRDATEELLGGTHCSGDYDVETAELLLVEVDAVRIKR